MWQPKRPGNNFSERKQSQVTFSFTFPTNPVTLGYGNWHDECKLGGYQHAKFERPKKPQRDPVTLGYGNWHDECKLRGYQHAKFERPKKPQRDPVTLGYGNWHDECETGRLSACKV